jgi:monoamine oxidase
MEGTAEEPSVDLAVIGAGVAGTSVAASLQQARPDWSIVLLERSNRIGGRLRSVALPGVDHPIELGGMRFLTSHRRVAALVEELGLASYPFDRTGGAERSVLRGRVADGPGDADAGAGYDLPIGERGRRASTLVQAAFETIIPGASAMDHATFSDRRATAAYLGRRLVDWTIAEALATTLSPEGQRFVTDAFGYDSGMRAFNVGDAIEFLSGGGDPTAEARTPEEGMDRIPGELAARFQGRGGVLRLGHEPVAIEVAGDRLRLRLADGSSLDSARIVLAIPMSALRLLAMTSPLLRSPVFGRLFDSVEVFPAMKLYLWYDRPWWRPVARGIRATTDLPLRKVFYLDSHPDAPAALLATYTDGRHVAPWLDLAGGVSDGSPAPTSMVREVGQMLRAIHPEIALIPDPAGSALMHWGSDPHEIGWTFWRAGSVSDELITLALQPDPSIPIHLAGETFSRSQSWVEGALESAELVVERLTAQNP